MSSTRKLYTVKEEVHPWVGEDSDLFVVPKEPVIEDMDEEPPTAQIISYPPPRIHSGPAPMQQVTNRPSNRLRRAVSRGHAAISAFVHWLILKPAASPTPVPPFLPPGSLALRPKQLEVVRKHAKMMENAAAELRQIFEGRS
ncbi:hypothetical protein AAF712_015249 [Marasmius tenuissimus]|uniref:Uncharacterized protein n=1 Tax=Marasmius tenuissimus TaxID=585030 RepID=A0ABR2ZAQ8_9AGAR